jgi:hypothetical protein
MNPEPLCDLCELSAIWRLDLADEPLYFCSLDHLNAWAREHPRVTIDQIIRYLSTT